VNGLPRSYASARDLAFNQACLKGRFLLLPPDADPGGDGCWLALRGTELLVAAAADAVVLPVGPAARYGWGDGLFVGRFDGRPCRLVTLPREARLPAGLTACSLVAAEPQLPIELLSLGGMARMMLHWEHGSRHCGNCGAPMTRLAGEWGKQCPACQDHHFPRIHPCVIVLVRRPGEVLLTRKPEWAPNRYSLVAGFLDFAECFEEAVAREVAEETGVQVANIRYLGSQCWPFPSQIMTGFVADYAGGEVVVDTRELADARWFPVDALPDLPPKRSIARYILDKELGLP